MPWVTFGRMRTPKPFALPVRPVQRSTLVASGISGQMIATAQASGRLHRIRRGVFIDAALWPDDPREQHLLRAVAELELFPAGVLSHQTAATSWNLPHPGFTDWHAGPVSITLPRVEAARSRSGPVLHHVQSLPAAQVTRDSSGRPVTSVARTAIDLAAGRSLPDALVILDGAARLLCASMVVRPRRSDFANPRLIESARQNLRQASLTRRAASLSAVIDLADPRRESPPESLSSGYFHLAGLPAPHLQAELRTPSGRLYPDFFWPQARLIGECDGALKYVDETAYVREKQREQALRDEGYRMVRWLAREIMICPQVVVERVARALC